VIEKLRNIAIIAHVDHGKTTLVDQLLRQSGTLDARKDTGERVMDSNDSGARARDHYPVQEHRHRPGRTTASTSSIRPGTPTSAARSSACCRWSTVLLLVDAVDGPMPQTRFVTQKAFGHGFSPIVVVNKIDRDGARPDWVVDQTFDLFDKLGASDEQLDFPVVYTSAINGISGQRARRYGGDMSVLFETIVERCPAAAGRSRRPVPAADQSSWTTPATSARSASGASRAGRVRRNDAVTVVST
jgi:GTP-binding protein